MILYFRKQLKILRLWVDLTAGQLFRWLNALSTDVVFYVRKKIHTHLAEKNAYYREFGYKRKKTSTIVRMRKEKRKKKKKWCFLEKKCFYCGGMIFPDCQHLWGFGAMGLLLRSWDILSHSCRSLTSCRAILPSKLVDRSCQVQALVALVDLAALSFPLFSPKLS